MSFGNQARRRPATTAFTRWNRAMFGRYELGETLGEGGFAQVFRAWDPALGREVALKALLPHLAGDPEIRGRFLAEARALAALRHPNIVTVYDVGEADGRPFFAMELVNGVTLASLLAAGPLDPRQVAAILRGLASAIDYLHGAGLVHRDIKAANVMLETGGRPVLMDFGIAKGLDWTGMTRTGVSLGTPEAMAPEQIRGEPAGPSADIYALGVLTYQLLAGRPPFVGDTAYVLHAHAYEPPPPLEQLRPGLPPAAAAAVAAALAKDPDHRPATAGRFVAAFTGEGPLPPPPFEHQQTQRVAARRPARSGPSVRNRQLAIGGIIGAVAVIAVALVLGLGRGGSGSGAAQATTRPPVTPPPAATSIRPVVSDLKVCDNVLTCHEGEFVARDSVVACFTLTPGSDGGPLTLVVTDDGTAPRGVGEPSVIGRSDAIPNAAANTCQAINLPSGGTLTAGKYWVWALDGSSEVVSQPGIGFRALAPATPPPPPPPTPPPPVPATAPPTPPTPPPTFRRGELVRANTPNDCLLIRPQPALSATGLDCPPDGNHVEVLDGPVRSGADLWWKVRRWDGGAEGWAREQYLAHSPDCDRAHDHAHCDSAIRPTPAPAPVSAPPAGVPAVAGDWTFTDYVRYGPGTDQTFTFHVRLTQSGTHVSGSGDLSLEGDLAGRTLRASYGERGASGQFIWTFTADGTRFEGAYTNSSGNGGNSYGRRASGAVSGADQATIFVIGPDVSGDRVRAGGQIYVCFTVSRRSHATMTYTSANRGFYDKDDDGTGACAGPFPATLDLADAGGRVSYRIEMKDGSRVVATATATLTVSR